MNLVRITIEHLSRNLSFKRRFSTEFNGAQLIVSPGAALTYWKPGLDQHDPMLLNIAREFVSSNMVVWDIGANVGLFAFAAATKVGKGKVLAVEADTWLVSLLRRSKQLGANRNLPVEVLPVAIADANSIGHFHVAQRGRATNFLSTSKGSSQTGGVRETHLVPCVTLDWIAEHYVLPDFIKIDIEGAEQLALQGAQDLLLKTRPVILIEVSGVNQLPVSKLLKNYDYVLYDASNVSGGNINLATSNTLALPVEKPLHQVRHANSTHWV